MSAVTTVLFSDLVASRELLRSLTVRELRSRYKRSALGWVWSLLNPLATMAIFTVVFSVILDQKAPTGDPSGLTSFPLHLLCGLLPFTFFSMTVTTSMGNLIGNGNLIRKVWFPRETIVLSTAMSLFVSLLIEMGLLSVALLIAGNMVLPWLFAVIPVLLLLGLFSSGVALMLAAANVYFRDITYLWTIAAQMWFYATPVIYPRALVPERWLGWYDLNPLTAFATVIRNMLFDLRAPATGTLLYAAAVSVVTFVIGLLVFRRLSYRFAEEL